MNALMPRYSADQMPKPFSPISPEGMAKALRMFSNVAPVSEFTPLMAEVDAERMIATVDAYLQPCSVEQAASLVIELFASYPQLLAQKSSADSKAAQDFKFYTAKVNQAFAKFSYGIGKRAVHAADGIPGQVAYKPQPSDIVSFANKEIAKLQNVKTMAIRHVDEHRRRAAERNEQGRQQYGTPEERKARVAALAAEAIAEMKLKAAKL